MSLKEESKMKVWELQCKEELYTLTNWESNGSLFYKHFSGKSMLEMWKPLEIEDIKPNQLLLDCSQMTSSCPVFNEGAVSILGSLMDGKAEVLPLLHMSCELYAINVINVSDYIDYSQAKVEINKEFNKVRKILEYAFIKEQVENETIFKIPVYKGTKIFVTDIFKETVEKNQITGLEFYEVWDSESTADVPGEMPEFVHDGPTCTFSEGMQWLDKGKCIVNDRWKLMKAEDGEILLGYYSNGGKYNWQVSVYFPPSFLDMTWTVVD